MLAAFAVDILFRIVEKSISSPPRGMVSQLIRGRKKRRIQALVIELT